MSPRARMSMPSDVEAALTDAGLRGDYDARPAYQRNDYLRWIEQAKTTETRSRRLAQMLDELARGGVYMDMPHRPSVKTDASTDNKRP
jgi:uncharacterized protein YdeI (YjbR/CyaY-like superfamily)